MQKLAVQHAIYWKNIMLIYCFCLCSFFWVLFCSVKMFWDVTKRINWSTIWVQSRRHVLFSGIVSLSQRGLLSASLTKPSDIQQQAATGQEANTFTCQQLSDWHTIPVGDHKSLTAIVRPSLHSVCRPGQSNGEKSKVENRLFINHPPCLLCHGTRPCHWSNSENIFCHMFLMYRQIFPTRYSGILHAHVLCALWGHILLIMRALKW